MARDNKGKGKNDHYIEGGIMLGIGIVFMLILVGAFGKAGKSVTNFFVGTFGYAVYAYFLALIVFGILAICKIKRPKISIWRLLSLLMFFAMVIGLLHSVSSTQYADNGYGKYLQNCYLEHNTAGGVLAGVFLYPLLLVDYLGIIVCSLLALAFGGVFVFYDNILAYLNLGKKQNENLSMVNFNDQNGITEMEIANSDLMVEDVQGASVGGEENYISLQEENTSPIDFGIFGGMNNTTTTSLNDRESATPNEKKSSFDTAYEILYGNKRDKATDKEGEKPVDLGDKSEYVSYTNDYRKNQINNVLSGKTPLNNDKKDKNESKLNNDLGEKAQSQDNRFGMKAKQDNLQNDTEIKEEKNNNLSAKEDNVAESKSFGYEEFVRRTNRGEYQSKAESHESQVVFEPLVNNKANEIDAKKEEIFEDKTAEEQDNAKLSDKIENKSKDSKFDNIVVEDKTASHNEIEGFEYLLRHQKAERERKENEVIERRHNLGGALQEEQEIVAQDRKRKERSDKGGVHNSSKAESTDIVSDAQEKEIEDNIIPKTTEIEPAIKEQKPVVTQKVDEEVKREKTKIKLAPYKFPPVELLNDYTQKSEEQEDFNDKIEILEAKLSEFGVDAKVSRVVTGPTFSRLELIMPKGISVKKIESYEYDIAMCLEAKSVRCQIPIPGKNAFGVEIPNKNRGKVGLKSVIQSENFVQNKKKLAFAVGQNCDGENYVADLAAMPHLLIAGATGAGKSVCLNSLIVSLIYKYTPQELKFLMVDPKQVELNMYNKIPHMLIPEAVSDKDKTLNLLDWAIEEMEMRYTLFKDRRVQKITDYNATIDPKKEEKLPYIVIIIDEVGDFMLVIKKELEERIVRLTQKARAAGIHLILATQRPSVDVITGTIKANLPARIAFAVRSFIDSKTILDQGGAEKLLRYGDMIFSDGVQEPERLQGTLIEGEEVNAICDYIRENNESYFDPDIEEYILNTNNNSNTNVGQSPAGSGESSGEQDELFVRALYNVVTTGAVSISKLQRKFGIGFPRAARLVDTMEELGYIGAAKDNKQRDILIDMPTLLSKYGDVSLE